MYEESIKVFNCFYINYSKLKLHTVMLYALKMEAAASSDTLIPTSKLQGVTLHRSIIRIPV